jgi:NitT/TauT family transport system substrate-binding protein
MLWANAQQEQQPIRFGILPAESAIPLIIAKENGYFKDEGVDVRLIPFNSPNDRNVAAQAHRIDGFIADIMTAITLDQAGFPVRMTSDINEDFKLLTAPKSGIDTFRKLDGKDVSLVPNYVLEYIMDVMAQRNNISYKVIVIPSISARFEALLANRISAVLFTEPQASLLAAQGAHVLADSEAYGIKAGATVFTEKAIQERGPAIAAFYRAFDRAVRAMNGKNVTDYAAELEHYGFPKSVTSHLRGIMHFSPAAAIPASTFKSVENWMKSKGTLRKEYTFKSISDFSFLP